MDKEKGKIKLEDFKIEDKEIKKIEEEICEIEFSKMETFPKHKFKLYEGERLNQLVESIKEIGIIIPIILWQKDITKDRYIILSGHNCKKAGELINLKSAPCVIKKDITEEEAIIIVTETNLRQRSFTDLSYSERAYCLAQRYSVMKHQGKKSNDKEKASKFIISHKKEERNICDEVQHKTKSRDILAKEYNLSRDKIAKYIRIATLNIDIMKMLDDEKIGFMVSYILSFIEDSEIQKYIADLIKKENINITIEQVELLRDYFEKGILNEIVISNILLSDKKDKKKLYNKPIINVKYQIIKKYFKENQDKKEIEDIIEKALEMYFSEIKNFGAEVQRNIN